LRRGDEDETNAKPGEFVTKIADPRTERIVAVAEIWEVAAELNGGNIVLCLHVAVRTMLVERRPGFQHFELQSFVDHVRLPLRTDDWIM
jgi:PIN domain nuclease of toxin-antitoxin system